MQGTIDVQRFMAYMKLLRKHSERHALLWYDRATGEHAKQDIERLFGEVLQRGLAKRKTGKLPID